MTASRVIKKLSALPGRLWRFGKRLYLPIRYSRGYPETLLFILGCQRSGTGLVARVFRNDLNSQVFGEFTPMSSQDAVAGIRLDPPDQLRLFLSQLYAPLVVVKPLVESQNALSLLGSMENLKIIWVYRDFRDVVASNLKKFGEAKGLDDIRPIETGDSGNWRSENVSTRTQEFIRQFYSEGMSPADASALFWYARNSLYFEQRLNERPDVLLVAYHKLVKSPQVVMRDIYSYLGKKYPGDYMSREVHRTSLGKGEAIMLTPEIESHCSELLERLNKVNQPGMTNG